MSKHSCLTALTIAVIHVATGAPRRSLYDMPRLWRSHAGFSMFLFPGARAMLPLVVELPQGAPLMEWVTPQHEEIDLNCEVSSYANAEL
jgi:hypothetical protein